MKQWLVLGIALATAGGLLAKELPFTGENWIPDPLNTRLVDGGLQFSGSNQSALVRSTLPRAKRVCVSASFRVGTVVGDSWSVAGVAIQDDSRNFWHVALVKAPSANGGWSGFELAEMRDGNWLSQNELKQAFVSRGRPWREGETYRFLLELDPEGITGTIRDEKDETLFRERYLFTAAAVTKGLPALHLTGGFRGVYSNAVAEFSEPVPDEKKPIAPYRSDSFVPTVTGKKTGFFHLQQNPDGRWWVIDPLGRGTVLLGVDHVTFWGHWCEKMKCNPHFEKNKKKYANKAQWEEEALARLKRWGFNFLGAGCDPDLQHRGLIHTIFLSFGDTLAFSDEEYYITPNEGRPCSGFPNVFHPDFAASCKYRARIHCAPNRDDPWLFGYFIDNELAWWGRGKLNTGLFASVLKKAATHTAKIALRDYLKAKAGDSVERFNRTWQTKLRSWDEILTVTELPETTKEQVAIKEEFLRLVAERYFSISAAAIREADPNHLVMGARFAGTGGAHPIVWEVSGKYCDLVTFNCYPWADLDANTVFVDRSPDAERVIDHFTKYYDYVKRPMLVTEWSFPALDSGLPCRYGAGQRFRTQRERTEATSLFARTMLSLPFLVGYDYFMWVDEPALGITPVFPEDSNYGLINEDGKPYELLTGMFAELQGNIGRMRNQQPPKSRRVTAKACPTPAQCLARVGNPAAGKSCRFTREGNGYVLATDARLELRGAVGNYQMIDSITWKGKPLSAYNAMICRNGPEWIDAAQLTDVAFEERGGLGILTLTSRREGPAKFQIVHRLTVYPDRPLILCELVSLTNLDENPLQLESVYFRLYSTMKETPKSEIPNLWKGTPRTCWMDSKDGRYIGFCAPTQSPGQFYFWVGESGDAHPDTWFTFPGSMTIPKQGEYRPETPIYVFCVFGDDGIEKWTSATDELVQKCDKK
ncbi:MAG: hypothetical protein IJR99_17080 [Kiritimatiellae bacterium]|nr:hypothetical protein [Kiritimatiellia bacterium]